MQLRLQFESKLNGLHSLHRDLEARYERAKQEIYKQELLCQAQKEKIESQSDELINLRALKVEYEAKLAYSVDTIKVLEQSNA